MLKLNFVFSKLIYVSLLYQSYFFKLSFSLSSGSSMLVSHHKIRSYDTIDLIWGHVLPIEMHIKQRNMVLKYSKNMYQFSKGEYRCLPSLQGQQKSYSEKHPSSIKDPWSRSCLSLISQLRKLMKYAGIKWQSNHRYTEIHFFFPFPFSAWCEVNHHIRCWLILAFLVQTLQNK